MNEKLIYNISSAILYLRFVRGYWRYQWWRSQVNRQVQRRRSSSRREVKRKRYKSQRPWTSTTRGKKRRTSKKSYRPLQQRAAWPVVRSYQGIRKFAIWKVRVHPVPLPFPGRAVSPLCLRYPRASVFVVRINSECLLCIWYTRSF